ncbi:MAG: tRNA 2-selenouridine synthase [Rhodocyclaceae bacterium]|nr:tRNA 2-selenouridine synthase [Rhodocyclaceae bacterium]
MDHTPRARRGLANVGQIDDFDEIIDVRSPAEFALDHVPGALSCPVLSDAERAEIGTLYKQDSPFAARRAGAAIVARRIAEHLATRFSERERSWRPLVYCWRGGKRSGALVLILRQVGWDAAQLEGGYKAFRRRVIADLDHLCRSLNFQVVSGPTGSGKSRLLSALDAQGEQVLDLEALAAHKGSVLGALPGTAQPSQKAFETAIWGRIRGFDPDRPVWVEAESRRIGLLTVPEALITRYRDAPSVLIEASMEARIEFLLDDYAYFLADTESLVARLDYLRGIHANETIDAWKSMARTGALRAMLAELLSRHYDPLYRRALRARQERAEGVRPEVVRPEGVRPYATDDLSPPGIASLAERIRADGRSGSAARCAVSGRDRP